MKLVGTFMVGLAAGVVVTLTATGPSVNTDPSGVERLRATVAETVSGRVPYINETYGFSLEYPKGLVIKEFNEEGDARTVVFQKPGEKIGFQVYVTPYTEDTITGERILLDVPSGVIEDLKEEQFRKDLRIATFISQASPLVGRSREIWFLKNGYLFEFTAYLEAEDMLRETLKTIAFTKPTL